MDGSYASRPKRLATRQWHLQTSRITCGSGWSHAPHPNGDASATNHTFSTIKRPLCHVLGHILRSKDATAQVRDSPYIKLWIPAWSPQNHSQTQFCPLTHEPRLRLRPPTTQTVGSSAAVVSPHAPLPRLLVVRHPTTTARTVGPSRQWHYGLIASLPPGAEDGIQHPHATPPSTLRHSVNMTLPP